MAKKVKEFPVSHYRSGKYEALYNRVLDGSIWELRQGTDFAAQPDSFRSALHSWCKPKGLQVNTRVRGEFIYVQLVKP